MAFTTRFFGTVWLAVCSVATGISQEPPAAPPPPPPPPKTAPAAAAAEAAAPPAPKVESNPGITMVQDLLSSLAKFDADGRPKGQKLGFEIPEKALNDYLAYSLRSKPRPGIGSMKVSLSANNQVSSEVELDFGAIQKWNPDLIPAALVPLLSGKRTIKTDAQFESGDGTWSFSLKNSQGPDGKALVNKVMMGLLQSLGSRQPESVDPSKPIPLPFGLKRVWTENQLLCGEN